MMKPLVSVLVAAYNADPWLAETLDSVVQQTWGNIELIVVDDGSKDNTLAIAKPYESSNVKVIHQENRGASAARNHALSLAQGDFIQYLDADDLLAPDKIERQVEFWQEGHPDALISGAWGRFSEHPSQASITPQPLWQDLSPVDWLLFAWQGHWMMHPAAWLVPRSLSQRAGMWDETLSLNDDGEYFCRVILASHEVRFCQDAISYYRSGLTGSLSGRKTDTAWRSAFASVEQSIQYLLARENSPRTRQVVANLLQRLIYEVYPDVPDLRHKASLQVQQLGGATERPMGGPFFQSMAMLLGWERSKALKNWIYKVGYQRLALGRLLASS